MSDDPGAGGTEDLRRRMREAIAQATVSPAVRNRKLVFWGVRQVLLCVAGWYFWDKPWMRWVFWIGVAIALINLAMILLMPRFLAAQQRRGDGAFDRLDALTPEDQPGAGQGGQR
ncbi:MAG: hypothetical protein JNN32_06120 [Flavobacteriales bacterium]|nr:hypothetical protein [Flavobacteriales bacterium]